MFRFRPMLFALVCALFAVGDTPSATAQPSTYDASMNMQVPATAPATSATATPATPATPTTYDLTAAMSALIGLFVYLLRRQAKVDHWLHGTTGTVVLTAIGTLLGSLIPLLQAQGWGVPSIVPAIVAGAVSALSIGNPTLAAGVKVPASLGVLLLFLAGAAHADPADAGAPPPAAAVPAATRSQPPQVDAPPPVATNPQLPLCQPKPVAARDDRAFYTAMFGTLGATLATVAASLILHYTQPATTAPGMP